MAALTGLLLSTSAFAQINWTNSAEPNRNDRRIVPAAYRTVSVNANALREYLLQVPLEDETPVRESTFLIDLPFPDGTTQQFRIVNSPIMAPELAAQFPEIQTYLGQGVDDRTATVRMDFTPHGFHAMVIGSSGSIYIDPYAPGETGVYISYTKRDFYANTTKVFDEHPPVVGDLEIPDENGDGKRLIPNGTEQKLGETTQRLVRPMGQYRMTPFGTQLRSYRLALACTGEYAAFHGGTVPLALAAMVTSMNRVNGVYEREVAIRMNLIANNNLLVYLNAATDPYTNNDGAVMLNENQTNVNSVIGSANYDIGHVFSTGGGGIAQLNSPCGSGKARGVTGLGAPIGDAFDIDYVAHEIGHQFGGNHTQNNSCNRSSSAAYEPGSASTIMGYANICAPDLQGFSDDYFHNHSINEIFSFSVIGSGNSCATTTSTGNGVPTVEAGTGGFTIPISTPFELTAVGSDPDADIITYNWEQYDLGPATAAGDNNLTNPSGNQPIFRSWLGTLSPTRVFPRIPDLVNNSTTIGEHLPTYTRSLRFRCTVRDNQAGGGGVNDDEILFNVSAAAGPFVVTSPNTAVSYAANSTQTVTWNVAGTNVAPVNATHVDIFLSTDGGLTFPVLLMNNTINDGSAVITLPSTTTTQARIKVKGEGNIFFDISNTNFTITAAGGTANNVALTGIVTPVGLNCDNPLLPSITAFNAGSNAINSFTVQYNIDGGANSSFSWTGSLAVGASSTFSLPAIVSTSGAHTFNVTLSNPNGLTDSNAANNQGSTLYQYCSTQGCTNINACNYNPLANVDDGSCVLPPSNDQCANPIALVYNAAASTVDNSGTCVESPNPTCGNSGVEQIQDIWFSFIYSGGTVSIITSAATGGVLLTDTRVAVYTSCGGTPIACDDDDGVVNYSLINFGCTTSTGLNGTNEPVLLIPGTTYYVQVGGFGNDIGRFRIEIDLTNVTGCTNPIASNYNSCANVDNGTCIIPGCTIVGSCNYNPLATQNNGSCVAPSTWYLDFDGDGFAISSTSACSSPGTGYTLTVLPVTDCNDTNGAINPNTVWYRDQDGDGFAISTTVSCTSPGAFFTLTVLPVTDCNDTNNQVNPGAPEQCNGEDDDCDGSVDEGVVAVDWYLDSDGDGFGAGAAINDCASPGSNYVNQAGDCNDANDLIYPGTFDGCDGIDNDCNGLTDEDYVPIGCVVCQSGSLVDVSVLWFLDADSDGYSAGQQLACVSPGIGWTTTAPPFSGDCNDSNGAINPGASELCNGFDDNCNLATDEGCSGGGEPGDLPGSAINVVPAMFPGCSNITGNLPLATASGEALISPGPDLWYSFTAASTACRVAVTSTLNNVFIELQNQTGSVLVGWENALSANGGETLILDGLQIGSVYRMAIRNINGGAGGLFTACVQYLPSSTCDLGPNFSTLCQIFKADNVASNGYVIHATDQSTLVTTSTVLSGGITTIPLGAVNGIQYGRSYNVAIDATYTLLDAAGNSTPVVSDGAVNCAILLGPQPDLDLRPLNAEPNSVSPNAIIGTTVWSCGASYFQWEFTPITPLVGSVITVNGPSISRFLNIFSLGLVPGGRYQVRIRPMFAGGTVVGDWGPDFQVLKISGPALMPFEEEAQADVRLTLESGNPSEFVIYPNPSNGTNLNVQIGEIAPTTATMQVRDATGRAMKMEKWSLIGGEQRIISFDQPLAPGIYMVTMIIGEETTTLRMIVQR